MTTLHSRSAAQELLELHVKDEYQCYHARMVATAVEAHAYGYNDFKTLPRTRLAAALLACDEICGIFFAYQKVNPLPYGEMKVKSIKSRLKEKAFAAKIDRSTIYLGCEHLEVTIDEHVENLIRFFHNLE